MALLPAHLTRLWGRLKRSCFKSGVKRIVSIQRYERDWPERNTLVACQRLEARRAAQQARSACPYARAAAPRRRRAQRCAARFAGRSLAAEGVAFTGGVHSRWLFHASRSWEQILSSHTMAFKSVGRRETWGTGTYLARDASYCDTLKDGLVAEKERVHSAAYDPASGTYTVLLCLAVTGMTTLGSAELNVALKERGGAKGATLYYDSACDCLSSPEIFVVAGDGVYPAYVVQYKDRA